jgi:hypothetical protein
MADAEVTYDIKGTSDVPQNVDKSKKAMSQMENAIEGLNKKISGMGKDLVLSYIAPMVLLNKAIDYVAQKIEEQRQKVADSVTLAERGSKYVETDVSKAARETSRMDKEQKEKESARIAPQNVTAEALKVNDKLFKDVVSKLSDVEYTKLVELTGGNRDRMSGVLARRESVQKQVIDAMGSGGTDGNRIDSLSVQGSVFGMGTISPLQVAMTAQLEEAQRQTELLQRIAHGTPDRTTIPDPTKPPRNWLGQPGTVR